MADTKPYRRRYPAELRERAVRMVLESEERHGAASRVAKQLGVGYESMRQWLRQAEIDQGRRPGVTTEDQRRIAELERENRELRRANAILRSASAFFARELDPQLPR
jgi:transposase